MRVMAVRLAATVVAMAVAARAVDRVVATVVVATAAAWVAVAAMEASKEVTVGDAMAVAAMPTRSRSRPNHPLTLAMTHPAQTSLKTTQSSRSCRRHPPRSRQHRRQMSRRAATPTPPHQQGSPSADTRLQAPRTSVSERRQMPPRPEMTQPPRPCHCRRLSRRARRPRQRHQPAAPTPRSRRKSPSARKRRSGPLRCA